MDALLLALLACLASETGDRSQLLALDLSLRYRRNGMVLAGLAVAAFANAALSAVAGWFVSGLIGSEARALFLALALLFGGAGMLFPARPPDPLAGWRLGAFLTTALGQFILMFGNGAQFLAAGIAARTADPLLTTIGAGVGVWLACAPVVLFGRDFLLHASIRWIRLAAAAVLLVAGACVALAALGLL